jgi:hypothetical protein
MFARRKFVARRDATCAAQWSKDLQEVPALTSQAIRDEYQALAARAAIKDAVFGPNGFAAAAKALGFALGNADLALTRDTFEALLLRLAAWCEKKVIR